MKLESLNASKFDAFRPHAIANAHAIIGGTCQNTTVNGQLCDSVDHETNSTPTLAFTCDGKTGHDWYDTICRIGGSEGQGAGTVPPPNTQK